MKVTTITTYSGLQFDVREACPDDQALMDRFWRHVRREDLDGRGATSANPADADQPFLAPDPPGYSAATYLAFGGDGEVISLARLLHDAERKDARISEFTRDGITYHGISWALLEHVLIQARAMGIETVESVFRADDLQAIELERNMGFLETGYPGDDHLRILRWNFSPRTEHEPVRGR